MEMVAKMAETMAETMVVTTAGPLVEWMGD